MPIITVTCVTMDGQIKFEASLVLNRIRLVSDIPPDQGITNDAHAVVKVDGEDHPIFVTQTRSEVLLMMIREYEADKKC